MSGKGVIATENSELVKKTFSLSVFQQSSHRKGGRKERVEGERRRRRS
jgi:hypothetical protein